MGDEVARLLDDRGLRHGAARAAGIRDDAEGAAMVAALLYLQIGARPRTLTRPRGSGGIGRRWGRADQSIALRPQLRRVVEDQIDLTERGIAFRRQGRGTASHDDARVRMRAARLPD